MIKVCPACGGYGDGSICLNCGCDVNHWITKDQFLNPIENVLYEETSSGNLVLDFDSKKNIYRMFLEIGNEIEEFYEDELIDRDYAIKKFKKTLKYYK